MRKPSILFIIVVVIMLTGLTVSAQDDGPVSRLSDGVPSEVFESRYNEAVAYFNGHPETAGIHGSLNTIELSDTGEKYRPNNNIFLCINPEYPEKKMIGIVSLSNRGDTYLEDVAAAEICAALYAFNADLDSVEEAVCQMQDDISNKGTTEKGGISYRNDSSHKTVLLTWAYDGFCELSAEGSPLPDTEKPEKEAGAEKETDTEKKPDAENETLSKGSTGDAVKEVQKMLIELGCLSGEADGLFGGKTEAAVKAFQEKNSLKKTGVVDETTYEKLKSSMTAISIAKASGGRILDDVSSLAGKGRTDTVKTVYSDKETIRKAQELLNKAGYDCGPADGVAGKKTGAQILAFKKDHGLPENTDITPELLEALEPAAD